MAFNFANKQIYGLVGIIKVVVLRSYCTSYQKLACFVPGPSEAVRHGGGRQTKNLQGEREKEEKGGKKERKKEKRGERKERGEKKKERERRAREKDVLGLWV